MRFFKRISDIISSNVNSVLDKFEDPEKMIDLSITELEDAIREMNITLAERKVQLNSLSTIIRDEKESIRRWNERAVIAAKNDKDELAREAIKEKITLGNKLKLDEESFSNITNLLESLNESKKEAEAKLSEMKAKSLELKTRAQVAKNKINTNEKIKSGDNAAWAKRMEEMKQKIEKWEALADITKTTKASTDFEDLETKEAIEKELKELKEGKK